MSASTPSFELARASAASVGGLLVVLLLLPIAALVFSTSPSEIVRGASHPAFASALWLSLRTTLLSLGIVVVCGTPLAWFFRARNHSFSRSLEVLTDLPIVLPPAVVGVSLLQAYGRNGWLGPTFGLLGVSLSFSTSAVVMAQVVVSAPFYVRAAANAFREVDLDLLLVGRTLGAAPTEAVIRIALPAALPGLVAGAAMAWARSLGEFGATLLFAGNAPSVSQTMPLAIYFALESDVDVAVAISIVLAACAVFSLFALRLASRFVARPSAKAAKP